MKAGQNIVVGVASVEQEDPVLPFSLELARRLDAELTLVHSYPSEESVLQAYRLLGYGGEDAEEHYRMFLRSKLRAMVAGVPSSQRIHTCAAVGPTDQVLSAHAADLGAALIVVGASRRGTMWRRLAGGCADRTVRAAPCPVLVFRKPFPLSGLRALFATDLSDYSIGIHEQAMRVVAPLLVPMGAARSVLVLAGAPWGASLQAREALERLALHELDHFLRERSSARFAFEPSVRFGDPASEILKEAATWNANLLVIGSQSRSKLERLLLGSVATEVTDAAGVNVLIVPPRATETEKPVAADEQRLPAARPSLQPLLLAPGEPNGKP
jgi:nucleotide-binding universal stress UspA family protein